LRLFAALALSGGLLFMGTSVAAASSAVNINVTLPAVTKTMYSISGIVYNAAGTAGVRAVEVTASSTSGYGTGYGGYVYTSATGVYTITGLLPGSYTLKFDPPRATNLQHGYRASTGPGYFTTSNASAALQTITTANLIARNVRLPNAFKISGKVTGTDGVTPIAGIAVGTSGGANYDDNTVTDSAGNYILMDLSPGSYSIYFNHSSGINFQTGAYYTGNVNKFSTTLNSLVPITTANVASINVRIPVGLKVTGYVKTRAATPLPIVDALVSAESGGFAQPVVASTDANGKFELIGLNPGSYTFGVGADGYQDGSYNSAAPYHWSGSSPSSVTVSSAVTLATIEPATAVVTTGFYISGRVTTTAGVPLRNIDVSANGGPSYGDAQTDGFGYYSVGPLAAGTYTLSLGGGYSLPDLQTGYYRNASPTYFTALTSAATGIPVAANVTGKNVQIPEGLTVSGVVTITGGQACTYCLVWASATGLEFEPQTFTDGTGAYKVRGLAPGSYQIGVNGYYATTTNKLMLVASGYYKTGLPGNYSASSATLVPVS
jgi:protocatechuate 3,4-dioxygenase beta subunit